MRLTGPLPHALQALLLLSAACGGETSTDLLGTGVSPSTVTASQACSDYANTYCAKESSCTNDRAIFRSWGDMATCVTREVLACSSTLAAPHTSQSPALREECSQALASTSCSDFLEGISPSPCAPSGPGAVGSPCTFNAQCSTAYCAGIRDATCGTCAEPPPAGASCATSNCGQAESCVWNAELVNVCESYVASGGSCGVSGEIPCAPDLACVGSSATTAGTCMAPVAVGAACDILNGEPKCDGTKGYTCVGPAGQRVCTTVSYVANGAACGALATGTGDCTAGTCYTTAGPFTSTANPTGTCKGFAADGAACDTLVGPGCLSGARCVVSGAGTAGVCTVPGAAVSAACL